MIKEPIDYFKMFWTDDITELIANETNLYSVQKTGRSIKTTFHEMEQLLGMQMLMGVVKMPKYMLYWMAGTRFAPIADLMTRKRYKDLRSNLHLVDNSRKDEPQNKDDRLFKIRPVLEKVRNNCIIVVPEPVQSIDEQIIPSKARTSGIRQYNPRKPKKWGYKVFVQAGQSGLMYDFFLYTGKNSTGTEKTTCASVVRKLCEHLPRKVNHKLAFDNWFTTLSLMLELKQEWLCVVGTLRTNRLENCPLLCDKDLKNCGRGSLDYRVDANSGLIVLKWNNNKPVHVTSSYATNEIVKDVQRFDRATKKYVQVPLPDIIAEYNSAMGGVDLADMLISLYRTAYKTIRWYLTVLFHLVDICKVNGWLMYRRNCWQMGIPKKKQLSLLEFISQVSESLMKQNKALVIERPVGRPKRLSVDENQDPRWQRRPVVPTPCKTVREDFMSHWPSFCR